MKVSEKISLTSIDNNGWRKVTATWWNPLILSQTRIFPGGSISGFTEIPVYTTKHRGFNSIRIQSIHFGFRIQNLRRHDQTGTFLFRIHPPVCKRQNESGTKTSRIRHESGKIPSSVNLVLIRYSTLKEVVQQHSKFLSSSEAYLLWSKLQPEW